MHDYRVELDQYHGPLDLLLYLIRRDEIDIHNIPIAPITEQYMQYLGTIEKLDINLAGEFLVMAATLMEIKSALLMPKDKRPDGGATDGDMPASEDPTDPRYELIHQLLAYKRFKDAAGRLDDNRESFASRFARSPGKINLDERQVELDLDDVSLWDLVEAFTRMMEQVGLKNYQHQVVSDDTPIELHAADLVDRLQRDGPMMLQQVFEGRKRGEMIGLFLATLELTRQRRLRVTQPDKAGPIMLELRDEAEVAAEIERESQSPGRPKADPRNPGNVDDFDWPDDAMRQRYLRRQERRAKGEFVEEDAELEADIAELKAKETAEDEAENDE
ncbi:MAG: segregation and condensation protein A [Phycisphaerales bacterium]